MVHILHPVNLFIISQQKTYIVLSVIRLLTDSVLIGLTRSVHTSWVATGYKAKFLFYLDYLYSYHGRNTNDKNHNCMIYIWEKCQLVVWFSWSDEFGSRAWAYPTNAIGCVSSTYSKVVHFRPVRLVVGSRPIPGIGAQGLKGAPRLSVWTHVVGQQKS